MTGIYISSDHPAIEANSDLAEARKAADDLLLMLPLSLSEEAACALPDCLKLAIDFGEGEIDDAVRSIRGVADELAASRDRVASLGGNIEASMAAALASAAEAIGYPLLNPFWGEVWDAVLRCLPAAFHCIDLTAEGHGILQRIDSLPAAAGFQAWLQREENPNEMAALCGAVPGMSDYLDALGASDDLCDALNRALPHLPALCRRVNEAVDFDRDRVNAELDLEFARAAARREVPTKTSQSIEQRLVIELPSGRATLDGRSFFGLSQQALGALDALARAAAEGKTPLSKARLRSLYLPACRHDKTLSRWFAGLPDPLRALVVGREGSGLNLILPAKKS